jgi:predicted RNA polymerase sigma factor
MALWKSDRSLPNSSDASKVKTSADEPAHRAVEAAARQSYGRLVALLAARTRDPAGAEDALADALLAALNTWARDGIPKNPQAWLLTAARHRLLDHARHLEVRERSASTLETLANELYEAPDPDALPDERLKLLFVCAHPAIDPDMHTPLMLQTVLGLDAVAIGRAFLVSPKAMGQRLARAKTKIRQARIAFEIPAADQIPQRLEAVLDAIYAAYGSSWEDAAGRDQRAVGLAEEAIWLARVLRDAIPDEPEVRGLLALLLHCEARRPARRGADGRFVPLSEQDPHIWLAPLIDEAERELAVSAAHARLGRFQIEAAIQSVHAERARTGRTDWAAIATFYDQLTRLAPSIGAAVARAAAHAEVDGAQAGLALLDQIDTHSVVSYQPYWAVRADLLRRLNCAYEAAEAFDRAIGLTDDDAVRAFLLERRGR